MGGQWKLDWLMAMMLAKDLQVALKGGLVREIKVCAAYLLDSVLCLIFPSLSQVVLEAVVAVDSGAEDVVAVGKQKRMFLQKTWTSSSMTTFPKWKLIDNLI